MKPRQKGAAVQRAVKDMDGADLIVLAKELTDAFSYLQGPDWAKDLGGFNEIARPALLKAFHLTPLNGQGKASKARLTGIVATKVEGSGAPAPFLPEE